MLSFHRRLLSLALVAFVSSVAVAQKVVKGTPFVIKNTTELDRKAEVAVFTRAAFASITGSVLDNQYPTITTNSGKSIPSQTDDLDEDGRWDEIALLVSVPAKAKISLLANYSSKPSKYPKQERVLLAKSPKRNDVFTEVENDVRPSDYVHRKLPAYYQYDGVGIENLDLGYAFSMDETFGTKVFGKVKRALVLDSAGVGTDLSKLQSWGAQVFDNEDGKFSPASFGLINLNNDSLVHFSDANQVSYKKISEGPLRAIFEVNYTGLTLNQLPINIKRVVILPINSYTIEQRIKLEGISENRWTLFSGIPFQANYKMSATSLNEGIYALSDWEKQSSLNDNVGLAILAEQELSPLSVTPKIANPQNAIKGLALFSSNDFYTFYTLVGWERSLSAFGSRLGFSQYLNEQGTKLNEPLKLSK